MDTGEQQEQRIRVVREYHRRSKHRPERYAAAPGYMDWDNQPNPFRIFEGAELLELPHPDARPVPTYDGLFLRRPVSAALDADLLGRLFYHSLALSAWKRIPKSKPWSLRINPASGALYPTEAYLISGRVSGLFEEPGVFHYSPWHHGLERRCHFTAEEWRQLSASLPETCLLLGLSTIYWRVSWKYGERAFRYSLLDVGHVLGALTFSARLLGWETRFLENINDHDLNRLLGIHLQEGPEAEHADCLLALYPGDVEGPIFQDDGDPINVPEPVFFKGEPNRLSRRHHDWPVIEDVARAIHTDGLQSYPDHRRRELYPDNPGPVSERWHSAEQIIRRRRSSRAMDPTGFLERTVFYQMLQRILPGQFPFQLLSRPSRISLVFFVHRVSVLESGLYLLLRNKSHERIIHPGLQTGFTWELADELPPGLQLYRLLTGDMRNLSKRICCAQDIAGDGAFSLAMLSDFNTTLATDGAAAYPHLHWECGLIGQVLYLEAEAAGMRGTGIGCYFDDLMHDTLGIRDDSLQSLYHFTVGTPVEDGRIQTIPPYAHLKKS
ncbi:MAG: nitroreductase family protein [Desulfobulbaceae bacterium]|nr:nitroreductase family protein [Desulfobulbaceae bacterium]